MYVVKKFSFVVNCSVINGKMFKYSVICGYKYCFVVSYLVINGHTFSFMWSNIQLYVVKHSGIERVKYSATRARIFN